MCIPLILYGILWGLSEIKLRSVETPPPFLQPIPFDIESINHGKHIARTRGCFGCHGQKLEGRVFTDQWPWVKKAVAPNLVRFANEYSSAVIEAAIRHGVGHDGKAFWSMPSYNWVNLSDSDLRALIAYLQTEKIVNNSLPQAELGLKARWEILFGRSMNMAEWASVVPPLEFSTSDNLPMKQGEYIAKTTCNECHGLDLSGDSLSDFSSPGLGIIASYSEQEFRVLMASGISRSGREDLGLMTIVAKDRFAYFTEEELGHLYVYLKSLSQ